MLMKGTRFLFPTVEQDLNYFVMCTGKLLYSLRNENNFKRLFAQSNYYNGNGVIVWIGNSPLKAI